jgi:hypothetical protein
LLLQGAQINALTEDGRTALDVSLENLEFDQGGERQRTVDFLRERGAKSSKEL